jgi:hypothetical protein
VAVVDRRSSHFWRHSCHALQGAANAAEGLERRRDLFGVEFPPVGQQDEFGRRRGPLLHLVRQAQQGLQCARHLRQRRLQCPPGVLDPLADGLLFLRFEQAASTHVLQVDTDEVQVFARRALAWLELKWLSLGVRLRIVVFDLFDQAPAAERLGLFFLEQAIGRQDDARIL